MTGVDIELKRTEKGWLGQALVLRDGTPAYLAESITPAPNILVRNIDGRELFRTRSYQSGSGIRRLGRGGVTYQRANGVPVRLDHYGLFGFRLKLYVGDKAYAWQKGRTVTYPWMVCSIPFLFGAFKARLTDPEYMDVAIAVLYYAWCRSEAAD